VDALARFGHDLGMAFQLVDDVLDMVGDERTLGKPIGGDLREAKVTLPTIYALARADTQDRRTLEETLESARRLTDTDIAAVRDLIERYDGYESAREMARGYVASAKEALAAIPASPPREALAALVERIVDRDH
jgi:geranylgeranyl pyrophosphate synthase